jgi:hypothetical protein
MSRETRALLEGFEHLPPAVAVRLRAARQRGDRARLRTLYWNRSTTEETQLMEMHFKRETETKLNELAQRTHRGADELLEEAVEHLVAYNEWFEGQPGGRGPRRNGSR